MITAEIIPVSFGQDPTLRAFCTITIDNQFVAADIGLHFRDGGYYLLYPAKRIRAGLVHYFKPVDKLVADRMLKAAVEAYKAAISERDHDHEVVNGETRQL